MILLRWIYRDSLDGLREETPHSSRPMIPSSDPTRKDMALRFLLTGGAGFIGSHLAETLVGLGHDPVVLDDLSTGRVENLASVAPQLSFHRASVLDRAVVMRLGRDVDSIVHLASPVGVERVARSPEESYRTIVDGAAVVLDCARDLGLPLLVVSSSEVYGFSPPTPIREEDVPREISGKAPRLSYARAKLVMDTMARRASSRGQRVLVARPFNVIGPRQSEEWGAVLPRFVRSALLGLPLEVHGDGMQKRTFLDVRDLADMLGDLLQLDIWNETALNVGGSFECSIEALARTVVATLDSSSVVNFVKHPEERGGVEIRRRVPDLTRLRSLVSLRPQRTVIESVQSLAGEMASLAAVS